MVLKFLLVNALLSSLITAAQAQSDVPLSTDDGIEILCTVLNTLENTKGQGVWPGYNPLEAPLLVRFHGALVGYGDSDFFSGWNKIKAGKCIAHSAPQDFHPPDSSLVPYWDFKGRKAFYFDATIKPELSLWLLSAVVHERFHRFQWEHFQGLFPLLSSTYLAHTSVDNVAGSFMENRKLAHYMREEQKEDWIDFLSLTWLRESKLTEESKAWERGQQHAEGTAVYVQMKSFELIEKEFHFRFRDTWNEKMTANLDPSEGVDGVIKWRHYAIGGMICDYLDRHSSSENWKLTIQEGSLESLFRSVLSFADLSDADLKKRGEDLIASSEGGRERTEASVLISSYLDSIKSAKDQITASRLQVTIFRPAQNCAGGGASQRTYYLPEGGYLGIHYSGSHRCGSDYQENWTEMPVLLENKNSAYFGLDDVRIAIDSSDLPLRDGIHSFKTMEIKSPSFSLQSSLGGTVVISGSQIFIDFHAHVAHIKK